MKLGAIFPQTEIGTDPAAVRDCAQAIENAGYHHLVAYEHVLGVDANRHPEYANRYHLRSTFFEPFVLFSYLAGLTRRIEFVFGVLVLPMRQAPLVAKQAATLDVLCGGRLRMGVGVGWNRIEHESMGQDYRTRGRRIEEQVEVLRALWTQEAVTFEGKWHRLRDVGLNPLPVQRPIPLWMGGHADPVLRRTARLADGWMPTFGRKAGMEEKQAAVERLRGHVKDAGRDPARFGLEGRVYLVPGETTRAVEEARQWEQMGATHLSVNTMGAGLTTADQHSAVLREFSGQWMVGSGL